MTLVEGKPEPMPAVEVKTGDNSEGGTAAPGENTGENAPPVTTTVATQTEKRKRKRRARKQRQADSGTNDPLALQNQQDGRIPMPAGKEGEVSVGRTLTPAAAAGKQEGITVTETKKRKRKRREKKKKGQEDRNVTASKGTEQVDESGPGVGGKESQDGADEEAVPAKKVKKEAPEGVDDLPKDGTAAGDGKEAVEKKNKRKRKRKRKISQVGNASSIVNVNGSKDEEGATNKTKEATPGDSLDTQKDGKTSTSGNEEPEKKNKRKRKRKRKISQVGNASSIVNVNGSKDEEVAMKDGKTGTSGNEEPEKQNKRKRKRKRKAKKVDNSPPSLDNKGQKEEAEEEEEGEGVPAKKLKKDTPASALDSQNTATTQTTHATEAPPATPRLTAAQKRRMKQKQRKAEQKKQTAITLTDSPGHSQTKQATQTAATTQQTPILHPSCRSQENKEKIMSCWTSGSENGVVLEEGDIEVIKSPFTCCYVPDLLENEGLLDGVKEELDKVELLPKNNDLYKFQQTADLKGVTTPAIARLRHLLYTDVRQWLIDVTGIPLSDTVDMGSSRYSHTDVLLCHDDELEGRRIAYILYLVPPWRPEDGGSLDLFSTDACGHPKDIVRSLVPKHNAFAFFQVSPISFHQVSEVLSRDKTRLSINGWFHGPPLPWPQRNKAPLPPLHGPGQFEEDDFYAWINPMYLDMKTQKKIRLKFCSESELELENFLTEEAYEKLSKAFMGESLAWECTGPANRQSYEVLDPDKMPQEIKDCRQFLQCEAFFLIISQLTGLKLHPMATQHHSDEESEDESEDESSAAEPNPRCRVEVQRWGHRCYTLIRDDCVDQHSALDVYLFSNVSEKWTQELGGHVTYISKDEDEELLTVVPRPNCLSLVYRDAQTLRFTKYINAASLDLGPEGSRHHCFASTYYE